MRPEHEPPTPRLRRPLKWEYDAHPRHGRTVRLWSRVHQAWSRQRAWTGAVHEALEAGGDFDAIAAATQKVMGEDATLDHARDRAGTYLFTLMEQGYVEMDFPSPPDRFAPHLETVKELGRGGVGVAWLCRDTREDRDVVVKHGWDYFTTMETANGLMRREHEIMSALDHTGVVRCFDAFDRDGLVCLVREFVDGRPLAEKSMDDQVFTMRALELIDIVAHLHGRGWLLLDLRPANFYVRADDDGVVLVDVGGCMPHGGIGAAHEIRLPSSRGTPGYSAPETRKRHRASTASDVFGLGRLLFSLAAGRRPLKNWGPDDLRAQLDDHPRAATIAAMCTIDPADRLPLETVRRRFLE